MAARFYAVPAAKSTDDGDLPGAPWRPRSRSLQAFSRSGVCSGVFLQGVVNTVLVVVVHVIADQPPEMLLVQCDDMVQHLAPGTSDPPFRYSILPGRLDARPFWFQTRRLQKRNHVSVEFQIAVHDRVAIRTGLGKRFACPRRPRNRPSRNRALKRNGRANEFGAVPRFRPELGSIDPFTLSAFLRLPLGRADEYYELRDGSRRQGLPLSELTT